MKLLDELNDELKKVDASGVWLENEGTRLFLHAKSGNKKYRVWEIFFVYGEMCLGIIYEDIIYSNDVYNFLISNKNKVLEAKEEIERNC